MSIEDDVMLAEPLAMPEGVHVGRNDPCPLRQRQEVQALPRQAVLTP